MKYIDKKCEGFGFYVEFEVTVEIRILNEHLAFHGSNLLQLQTRVWRYGNHFIQINFSRLLSQINRKYSCIVVPHFYNIISVPKSIAIPSVAITRGCIRIRGIMVDEMRSAIFTVELFAPVHRALNIDRKTKQYLILRFILILLTDIRAYV